MNPQSDDTSGVPAVAAPPDNQDGVTKTPAAAPEGPEAAADGDPQAEGPEEPHQHEYPFTTPMPEGVPPELARRVDEIAPPPPQDSQGWDDETRGRWEICARTAALMALHQQDGREDELSDTDLRQWAWHAARSLFDSEMKTGHPDEAKVPPPEAEPKAA